MDLNFALTQNVSDGSGQGMSQLPEKRQKKAILMGIAASRHLRLSYGA
ncbi:hypothetical protein N9A80_00865 [Rhodopirellula sp.]|nr:hypothetical protein [Rhodopirellula sp.]MDA7904873.1 hypothetical protein [Rhodopirellula sp.]MDB4532832.1 hypothetical protein [bacterium]